MPTKRYHGEHRRYQQHEQPGAVTETAEHSVHLRRLRVLAVEDFLVDGVADEEQQRDDVI